ncbi:hypothetical protein [Anoxybacillus sp. CHMUD]|uniref:hypothetical protein n=1 Tax=Anoxybacillus sp. CHMUD TaxID=2508870 RepID=UPI00149287D7|nr:hypothetical protein [Anoxybacillus sp. CHMUD]NNU90259.1 hypothetical protein [Anoxybacillus sp. CHMUD]
MLMELFRENAGLTRDFHPRVEGKTLPMDLFRENACAPMSHFHARVESKNCSWNFYVKKMNRKQRKNLGI